MKIIYSIFKKKARLIVKTRLRNKMEDGFLRDCLLIYIEKEIAARFRTNEIIDEFNTERRRVPFDWKMLVRCRPFVHFASSHLFCWYLIMFSTFNGYTYNTVHILLNTWLRPIHFCTCFHILELCLMAGPPYVYFLVPPLTSRCWISKPARRRFTFPFPSLIEPTKSNPHQNPNPARIGLHTYTPTKLRGEGPRSIDSPLLFICF